MNHDVIAAFKTIFSALGGVALSVAVPVVPYASVCVMMIMADAVTAWRLGRRVAAIRGGSSGKLRSAGLGQMFGTIARVLALLLMARAVQMVIVEPDWPFDLVRILSAAVCLWQALSMLENEASCRGARWARIARRWLIDKTERHTGIQLDELKSAGERESGSTVHRGGED